MSDTEPFAVLDANQTTDRQDRTDRQVLVRSMTHAARGIVTLELTDPDRRPLAPWDPGAHIDLVLPSGIVRQYSLCGDPEDVGAYRIAVLREERSRGGSREVHDTGLVGKQLSIVGPRNTFRLTDAPRYLFLAGGIGITPILSMIRCAERAGIPWKLIYAGRTREKLAFLEELCDLRHGQVELVVEDRQGRPDFDQIFTETEDGTAVYCCGPPGMIRTVEDRSAEHLPPGTLRIERFVADPDAVKPSEQTKEAFEVELAQTGVTLTVPPDRSILDVVLEVVPHQLYSCEEGVCGTCQTRVLAGEPDHRDSVLTDEERKEYMMICVGRSRSTKLVLDL
jgi:ferredoxin-NADP reductase